MGLVCDFFETGGSMNTETLLLARIDQLTQAVQHMATLTGARLTREQVCQRLDVHRNTLARYIAERNFPTPGQDGKWLLAEVIDWETRKSQL